MHQPAISPLETFRKAFHGVNWITHELELRYPFGDRTTAERAVEKAVRLFLSCGLALTAAVEEYPWNGEMKIALVIRPVPEEYTFQDEAQDTEEYEEERAEWVGQE